RLVRPRQALARQLDLFGAERLAVRLRGAGAVGRALADGRLADDDRRLVAAVPGLRDRRVDGIDVVPVDRADHVPAIGLEALAGIVDVPGGDRAVDADAVVVVEGDQLVQLPG